jgi:hypothetical protein
MRNQNGASEVHPQRRSTLLALVCELTASHLDEQEVVQTARRLVHDGDVVLTGNFRGCARPFEDRSATALSS